MCQFEVTTINELKLCSRAQRLVSSALPKVFRADRSRSMQQVKYLEYRGVIRAISFELVARCTPVISRRLPRSVASNSMASGMRAAAPVSATMPSALVSSDASSLAIRETNQMNPPVSRISPLTPAAIVKKPIQRARPANMSVDHFKGVVDGMPGGQGGHEGNHCNLAQHSRIAPEANRERAKKKRCLVCARAACEPSADNASKRENHNRGAAAYGTTLQPEDEKMMLKMLGDETVFRANQMQHLDDRLIGRHRTAGCKGHR